MDIAGLDKAEVLAALYNRARQQGIGILILRGRRAMTVDEARQELDKNPNGYFDYLHGRVLKIELNGNELNTFLYNRDNGPNAAESCIHTLRYSQTEPKS